MKRIQKIIHCSTLIIISLIFLFATVILSENAIADITKPDLRDWTAPSRSNIKAISKIKPYAIMKSESCGKIILENANKYKGIKYNYKVKSSEVQHWLEENKKPKCLSCSTFTHLIFNFELGLKEFPTNPAVDQAVWGADKKIVVSNKIGPGAAYDASELMPGDVIFFKGSKPREEPFFYKPKTAEAKELSGLNIGHAGIYAGNDKFIHAGNNAVAEESLSEYINSHSKSSNGWYRGAIRICKI